MLTMDDKPRTKICPHCCFPMIQRSRTEYDCGHCGFSTKLENLKKLNVNLGAIFGIIIAL